MHRLPLLALAIAVLPSHPLRGARPRVIELWPEGVPGLRANAGPEQEHDGQFTNIHHPSLTIYPAVPGRATSTAAIYAPRGGYAFVAVRDSGPIIRWLNSLGITVFLLKYRHAEYEHPAPLRDALRAVRLVRSRAAEFGVDRDRIGMVGNSAGAHLAATAGTLYDAPEGQTGAELDKVSGRPDFMVLVFPIISMQHPYTHGLSRRALLGADPAPELERRLSPDHQVNSATPPTFLVHSAEDRTAPVENSLLFYRAMREAKAPVEMHLFSSGPHGSGMADTDGPVSEWPRLCEGWMRHHGWLPARK